MRPADGVIALSTQRSPAADVLTDIMLVVFRVNARLLEKGDQLVAPLQLTSARWQVIGAIALADKPLTAPQIASAMGITRQGAQKQLNLAEKDKLIETHANPRHERSPLYGLTKSGKRVYDAAMALQAAWAKALVHGSALADLKTARELLNTLDTRLVSIPLPPPGG